MPNSSLIEQRRSIPSSDRAPRRHHITTCSWRPSSPILPGLTFNTPDEVLGTHSSGLRAHSFAKRLVPIMPTGVLDSSHPPKIERVLRHLEFAHCRTTQLVFCQELRLVVLHERQQPVA